MPGHVIRQEKSSKCSDLAAAAQIPDEVHMNPEYVIPDAAGVHIIITLRSLTDTKIERDINDIFIEN